MTPHSSAALTRVHSHAAPPPRSPAPTDQLIIKSQSSEIGTQIRNAGVPGLKDAALSDVTVVQQPASGVRAGSGAWRESCS